MTNTWKILCFFGSLLTVATINRHYISDGKLSVILATINRHYISDGKPTLILVTINRH